MIKCLINESEYRLTKDFYIQEKLGNVISTNVLVEIEDGQRIPQPKDIIKIKDTTTNEVFFTGVAGIPSSPKYNSLNEKKIYRIKCQNANAILKNRRVNYAAEDVTVTEVIQYLFDNIIAEEGITLGTLSTIDTKFKIYVSPNLDLQKVLNEIAKLVNATWTVSSDLVFDFVAIDDFPSLSETIDEDFIFGDGLQSKSTGIDVRTVQIIDDASQTTDEQTENFVYIETTSEFNVRYQIQVKPTIIINEGTVDEVIVPSGNIGIRGLDDQDATKYFLFSYNSTTISYNEDSSYLDISDNVQVKYIGAFDIRIEAINQSKIDEIAALTGTSGLIEDVVYDASIKTIDDGLTLAESLLEEFEENREELKWNVYSNKIDAYGLTLSDFKIGTAVTFDLPDIGLEGTFIIVERKLKPFSADSPFDNMSCMLKLYSRNYLRAYGETFNNIDRQLANISIRENQIIIQSISSLETTTSTEVVTFGVANAFYPVGASTGAIFAPDNFTGNGGAYPI